MNRRQRHSRLSPFSGVAERDTEALQTDVMRFMSIISLCLVAVFALVQTIPVLEKGNTSSTSRIAGVHQKTDTRTRQANASQIQVYEPYTKITRPPQVSKVTQDTTEKKSAVESRTTRRTPAAPAVKTRSRRQAFSLQFESAAALDQLVEAGGVVIYAMVDKQAWRLSMGANGPVAVRSLLPARFHEMSLATVPEHYIRGLKTASGGPGAQAVVWGVQLPAATSAAIASRMRSPRGGVLVIRSDGRVVLEE